MSDSIDFCEIKKILQSEILIGATPSQAGRKVIERYGLISVIDMLHCFLDAFQIQDTSFTATIFVWEPYETTNPVSDTEFDRKLIPMIEKARYTWAPTN